MGFLLRPAAGRTGRLSVDEPGALTTLVRTAGDHLLLLHGDLLDRGFPLPGPDTAPAALVEVASAAFARHCGVLVRDGDAVLWTDHGALCPLHYARDAAGHLAVSTSAAALQRLLGEPVRLLSGPRQVGRSGFAGIAAVPPGSMVTVPLHAAPASNNPASNGSVSNNPASNSPASNNPASNNPASNNPVSNGSAAVVAHFTLPAPAAPSAEQAVDDTGAALAAAVAGLLADVDSAGVLLSGGVDSSTVATLAARQVSTLRTYTVGTPFGNEFAPARAHAEHIGSTHEELTFTPADLTSLLPRMVRLLETWDLTTLQIVAPICFVLDKLRGRESVLLTGYGADLLYAGLGGADTDEATEAAIRAGVVATGCSNEFNPAVAEDNRIAVRHPYWAASMITTALAIPAALKLRDGTVKWALRNAAARVVPTEVAFRAKIAIQEGTAMHHMFAAVLGSEDPQVQADRLREWAAAVFAEATASGGTPGEPSDPAAGQREEGTHARLVGVAS